MRGQPLSRDRALALRRHYARLAHLYGERYIDALLEGRYRTAAQCERAYRQAAARCRALGEQIHDGSASGRAATGLR
jgi:hypothetical protein